MTNYSPLKFIGSGSAFNVKLGNNSAYFKENDTLYLIDCGSSTFAKILEKDLLKNIKKIHVIVTHNHPDHIGSLGDLAFYTYYNIQPMFEKKLTVYSPEADNIDYILQGMGVTEVVYDLVEVFDEFEFGDIIFSPIEVEHVSEIWSFGYMINLDNKTIYYSGDSNMIPDQILENLENGRIDYFYQDTCGADYEENVHLSLKKLSELIKNSYRSNVWCMHLDNSFDKELANSLGFNVVQNEP